MSLSEEEDKRISAAYGVTPGEWETSGTFNPCRFDISSSKRAGEPPNDYRIAIGSTANWLHDDPADEAHANARLMAASKELVALLERAGKVIAALEEYLPGTLPAAEKWHSDSSALLERLKGEMR